MPDYTHAPNGPPTVRRATREAHAGLRRRVGPGGGGPEAEGPGRHPLVGERLRHGARHAQRVGAEADEGDEAGAGAGDGHGRGPGPLRRHPGDRAARDELEAGGLVQPVLHDVVQQLEVPGAQRLHHERRAPQVEDGVLHGHLQGQPGAGRLGAERQLRHHQRHVHLGHEDLLGQQPLAAAHHDRQAAEHGGGHVVGVALDVGGQLEHVRRGRRPDPAACSRRAGRRSPPRRWTRGPDDGGTRELAVDAEAGGRCASGLLAQPQEGARDQVGRVAGRRSAPGPDAVTRCRRPRRRSRLRSRGRAPARDSRTRGQGWRWSPARARGTTPELRPPPACAHVSPRPEPLVSDAIALRRRHRSST